MVVNGSGYASQSYNDVFLKNWMAKEENAKAQEGQPGVQGDSAQAGGVFADGRQRKEAGTEGVSGGNGMETETEKECRGKTRRYPRQGGEFTNCSNCPGQIVLTDENNRATLPLALGGTEC